MDKTALHGWHIEHGARMTGFAGYDMPLHYAEGILAEHSAVRGSAGLFDVSHMGQIHLPDDAETCRKLQHCIPIDFSSLKKGTQRYTVLLNAQGGIVDDLMIGRREDGLFLVVNAARRAVDQESLAALGLSAVCLEGQSLLALQGLKAVEILSTLCPDVEKLRFMGLGRFELLGQEVWISRSGYTGEDGFEISLPDQIAQDVAEAICARAAPIGLAARDSLRLEAGLCLYGQDLDETTSPIEAGLAWVVQKSRRESGDFAGAERILSELTQGAKRHRIGLKLAGRVPARAGAKIRDSATESEIGLVTSGGYSPCLKQPIAMGYIESATKPVSGTILGIDIRGKSYQAETVALPFVPHRYKL